MSAEQCLNHTWLKRKSTPKLKTSSSMDVTKDNLRLFVERWNEHPNSPYIFEITNHLILPTGSSSGLKLSNSSHSLSGMSPSPCGSLASSLGSDDAFMYEPLEHNLLTTPPIDHFRRASDSSCIIHGTNVAERVNLAEEIKKLSDKLFKLSTINTSITNTDFAKSFATDENKFDDICDSIIKDTNSKIEEFTNINVSKANVPKSEPINVIKPQSTEVPWRRPKFKVNNMSRDVPLSHKKSSPSFQEQFNARLSLFNRLDNSTTATNPTDTKDMLLQLLEQWDDARNGTTSRVKQRHASISSEWSENDALGQKTISSLNMFFQSRATNKKTTHFHKT